MKALVTASAAQQPSRIPLLQGRLRLITSLVVGLAIFMVFLDITVVNVAFSSVRRSFPQASLAGLSWVLSAYSIAFAALLVPLGRVADLFGERRVFLLGLVLFTTASGLCALAQSVSLLVAARVVQAVGAAALVPAGQALMMGAFPPERRTVAVGGLAAAGGVAAGCGPPLAGALVDASSWRLVFLINLPLGVAALVGGKWLQRASRTGGLMPDFLGAGLLAAGTGCVALGLVEGGWWGWSDPRILGAFAIATMLIPAFIARCARHRVPVVDLSLLRLRTFMYGNAATLLLGISFYALLLGNALFLTTVWRWSVLRSGLAMAPTPIAAALVAPVAGALAGRRDPRLVVAAGALLLAGGAMWLGLRVPPTPQFWSAWFPGAALTGVGLGLSYATSAGVTVAHVDAKRFGVGSGINAMMRQLGAVLGVALTIALLGRPTTAQAPAAFARGWYLAAVTGLMVLALTLAFTNTSAPPVAYEAPRATAG